MTELARFGSRLGDHLRAVIVASPDADGPELPGFALYHDAKRQLCSAYGRQAGGFLIRPDGYYRLARPVVPRAELDQLSPTGIQLLSACWPGPARDSLIRRINSLMARLNSLLGRNKFPVPMRRELPCKLLTPLLNFKLNNLPWRPRRTKFPVFSQLAGGIWLQRRVRSILALQRGVHTARLNRRGQRWHLSLAAWARDDLGPRAKLSPTMSATVWKMSGV
jgi:hypothetical protein